MSDDTQTIDCRQNRRGAAVSAFSRWYFSLLMLLVYFCVFLLWKSVPSRISFVLVGMFASGVLIAGMILAARREYFVNRTDRVLHGLVIVDLLLETWMYELFVAVARHWGGGQITDESVASWTLRFHDNNNFLACALVFSIIVGLNRAWALRKRRSAS